MTGRTAVAAGAVVVLAAIGLQAQPAAAGQPSPAATLDATPSAPAAFGLGGQAAVDALGPDLDAAAAVNRQTPGELRRLLTSDHTAHVGAGDRLYFVDDIPRPVSPAEASPAPRASYPYDQTFSLHSDPGATRSIYLNFRGGVVAGTAWNSGFGVSTAPQPAFDNDGDPNTFSTGEQDLVQNVWQRVAEDYAPFDVDVTTADPGAAGLDRADGGDTSYGTMVLIGRSDDAFTKTCNAGCGGIAYIGTYNRIGSSYYQPAWVFTGGVGNSNPKYIAEAASHEAGHNVGLSHDGTTGGDAYYRGAGAWAPIMGAGYYLPLTTFSKGEYSGANNQQDDFSVIANTGAPLRSDDFPDTAVGAPALDSGVDATTAGRINSAADKDYLRLTRSCASTGFSAAITPAPVSPDLRVQARLLDGDGNVLAQSDNIGRATTMVSSDVASDLSASLSLASLAPGTYYLELDGAGSGDPTTDGFSDYASVGAYSITTSSCRDSTPSAVQDLRLTATDSGTGRATVSWAPPANGGTSALSGYRVSRSAAPGQDTFSTVVTGTTFTFGALQRGNPYTVRLAAINGSGDGPSSSLVVTLGTSPSAPASVAAYSGASGSATVTWTPPAQDGGSPVTGYVVSRDGRSTTGAGPFTSKLQMPGTRSFTMTKLVPGATYRLTVQAVNANGTGVGASALLQLVDVPGAPTRVTGTGAKNGATVAWSPPATDGGQAITGYRVTRDGTSTTGGGAFTIDKPADARTQTLLHLRSGDTYSITVRAINSVGMGPAVRVQVLIPVAPARVVIGKASPGAPGGAVTANATWTPAGDGGAPITGYVVHALRVVNGSDVEQVVSPLLAPDATSYAFDLTRRGQWHFFVLAENVVGLSPRSAVSNTVAGA